LQKVWIRQISSYSAAAANDQDGGIERLAPAKLFSTLSLDLADKVSTFTMTHDLLPQIFLLNWLSFAYTLSPSPTDSCRIDDLTDFSTFHDFMNSWQNVFNCRY
jgi:hypothetical protein